MVEERLQAVITLAADALAREYDVCGLRMCSDLSFAGAELIEDAGFHPEIVEAKAEALGVCTKIGHAWIRVDGWNVDFALGQFRETEHLPYPFVTWKDEPAALELYGQGSPDLLPPLYVRDVPQSLIFYPKLESVIRQETVKQFQGYRFLELVMDILPYYRAVQRFRREASKVGLMDKPIPKLKLSKTLPKPTTHNI
jgi:hypothetical protein